MSEKTKKERKLKDGIGVAEKIFFLCVFAVFSRMIFITLRGNQAWFDIS
jgi:hypothetical protein